jgi:hypothetical protein
LKKKRKKKKKKKKKKGLFRKNNVSKDREFWRKEDKPWLAQFIPIGNTRICSLSPAV